MYISGAGLPKLISQFENPVGIEIGLSAGHTTRHLFSNLEGLTLHGIDPYPDYTDWNGFELRQDLQSSTYNEFLKNTEEFRDGIKHYRMFSDEAASKIADKSCDFIFIDGLHTYDQVLKDCQNFYSKIKDGGLFAGHDYNVIPDVNRAVNEFAASVGATISLTDNDVWYWFKPKNVPIVTCTVSEKCIPVLATSVERYCPGVQLIVHKGEKTTFGEAFNKALDEAFLSHDEVIICNDDVVLTPSSYQRLMEDVAALKVEHGKKLGFVAAHTDSAFPVQNIRFQNNGEMDRYRCQWDWEGKVREEVVVAPIFAWISKKAWRFANFPPINWFSDDVICRDLGKAGFRHFVSRSYVHHVGSQTVGHDDGANSRAAEPWIRANRPDYANMWFGPILPVEPAREKPLKICVYAISKNEEAFVERFCLSAKDADLILIADTGSTDRTREVAQECGAQVYTVTISPWRFDHARNAALALVPEDYDVCVSIDLDEVLEPGWRQEVERLWKNGVTRLRYLYDWGSGVRFKYEKIHARKGYRWHHPCHEYPTPDLRIPEVWADTDKLLVSHYPDPQKSRGQYLDLLELSVKEDPLCPRNAFYYARELSFYGRWDESIERCKKYLAMPTATWHHERSYAMRVIAKCYDNKGEAHNAEGWYYRAAAEAPSDREPWCELAQLFYNQGRWLDCYSAAMRALSIKNRELVYTCDPSSWGEKPHDLAAIAAWHLGLKDAAKEQGELAVKLNPDDKRLQENLLWFRGEKG